MLYKITPTPNKDGCLTAIVQSEVNTDHAIRTGFTDPKHAQAWAYKVARRIDSNISKLKEKGVQHSFRPDDIRGYRDDS